MLTPSLSLSPEGQGMYLEEGDMLFLQFATRGAWLCVSFMQNVAYKHFPSCRCQIHECHCGVASASARVAQQRKACC